MKRGRNQRRRQGVNPNRALDSNGPDVRIRGTANQIYDKYQALARDAASSGDRIKAESYLQHAEHYFRLIRAAQQANQQQHATAQESDSEQPAVGGDARSDAGSENGRDNGKTRDGRRGRPQRRNGAAAEASNDDEASASEAENESNAASRATAEAAGEEEKKPRRRRTTRKKAVKNVDNDEAGEDDGQEEEKAPAAAAE